MRDWRLDADEIVRISVDELALHILNDVHGNSTDGTANRMTWIGHAKRAYPRQPAVLRALSAAWTWLDAKALIAWDPDGGSRDAVFITDLGLKVLEQGSSYLQIVARLDLELHRLLAPKVRPHFLRGDYETAIFVAMKEVEVQVRLRAHLPNAQIGVRLMQEALGEGKPLARPDTEMGEIVAEMNLFKGAIGLFKNPISHRPVSYQDPIAAMEIVLLADLLLRLLDERGEAPTTADAEASEPATVPLARAK